MIVKEKNNSLTINCQQRETTMSTRSFGMVGKTYKSASEALKDADYATAIETPTEGEYSHIWAILGVLSALGLIVWIATRF